MSFENERNFNPAHTKLQASMTIEDRIDSIEMDDGTFKSKIFFKDTGKHVLFGKFPTWEAAINAGIVEMDRLIAIGDAAHTVNL